MATVRCLHLIHAAEEKTITVKAPKKKIRRAWQEVLQAVGQRLGEAQFKNYFDHCAVHGVAKDRIIVTVRNNLAVEKIENEYLGFLRELWRDKWHTSQDILLCEPRFANRCYPVDVESGDGVSSSSAESAKHPASLQLVAAQPDPKQADAESNGELVTMRVWNQNLLFENFAVGRANEVAYKVGKQIVTGGATDFNPVYFYGANGIGKTHLMSAIANEIAALSSQKRILYLSAEKFLTWFVSSIRNNNMSAFKEKIRDVDYLLIDDIHIISGRKKTEEEFLQTLSQAVSMGRQVILSGDCPPAQLEHFNSRIHSFLEGGLPIEILEGDYELRRKILEKKLAEKHRQFPGFKIESGLLDFIAGRVLGPGRVLEGALNRVLAQTVMIGEAVTLENVKFAISNVAGHSDRRVTVDEIQKAVVEYFDLSIEELLSARRTKLVAHARQVAMYLCRSLTTRSYPDIAKRFRKRDHTTVMHAFRKIKSACEKDSEIGGDIEAITRALRTAQTGL